MVVSVRFQAVLFLTACAGLIGATASGAVFMDLAISLKTASLSVLTCFLLLMSLLSSSDLDSQSPGQTP